MYNEVSFEGYKIFKLKQNLKLKPITILFGKNNSGKSSILGLPLLISNSFHSESKEVVTPDYRNEHLFVEHKDLVYGRANRAIKISVSNEVTHLAYSFYIDENEELKSHLESWCLGSAENPKYKWDNIEHQDIIASFRGVIPIEASTDVMQNLQSLDTYVDYIGNVRHNVGPDLRMGNLQEFSGWEGENGYDYLLKDSLTSSRELIGKVSSWYEKTFPGWSLNVDSSNSPVYHIVLENGESGINVANTGFGIRQSLPIVIRAKRSCQRATLIVLEEPEAHLHPAAHGNLGELFVDSVNEDPNKSYLIETHSFNLILRLRALIASGRISSDQVALYYVDYDSDEKSSNVKGVSIDENGDVDGWPSGVFEETFDEVVNIRKSQNFVEE